MGGVNHLSTSMLNIHSKILSEFLLAGLWGFSHLSMSMLNLQFKIISELLLAGLWGVSIIFPCPD